MAVNAPKRALSAYEIAHAPAEPGVYALWDHGELIYLGRTVGRGATIRSAVVDHWAGCLGNCTKKASHFSWEISQVPVLREAELLEEFKLKHGTLPRCRIDRERGIQAGRGPAMPVAVPAGRSRR